MQTNELTRRADEAQTAFDCLSKIETSPMEFGYRGMASFAGDLADALARHRMDLETKRFAEGWN